jgi:hypothetical protein
MAVNLEQHHAFHAGFETIEKYFTHVQKEPDSYDCEKVVGLIDEFGPVFLQHLCDEIETLDPEKMHKLFKDASEAKDIIQRMVEWIVSTAPAATQVPFVSFSEMKLMTGHDAS